MNTIQKRFLLYLFGCIGMRTLITIVAKNLNENLNNNTTKKYFKYFSLITLSMGLGFLYIYIFGSKKADSQLKWANSKVWWNDYRIIHAILYISFSIMALLQLNNAWVLLALDTLLGLIIFLKYHYVNGNFNKLI
tara:strand:- start:132 stop:536 length:405 start_codon:yes stop_codon:yes gene_type:complete